METYEKINLTFEKYSSTTKDDAGRRTAMFRIQAGENEFGVTSSIVCFGKTAKQLKKGASIECSVDVRMNHEGYLWISMIR